MPTPFPIIDETTDIFDCDVYNQVIALVHERCLASGSGFFAGYSRPTATPHVIQPGDDLQTASADYYTHGPLWDYYKIADLQLMLQITIGRYLNHERYGTSLVGWDGNSEINSLAWTPGAMGEAIGNRSEGATDGLFSRRISRRINSLSDTKSYDAPFGLYLGDCEVGDIAQYFPFASYYRGIYVYQGGGVWVKAPPGSSADTLDSNQPTNSHLWCPHFNIKAGDIVDWKLIKNIVDVASKLQVLVYPLGFVRSSADFDTNETYLTKTGSSINTTCVPTSSGSQGAAISDMNAATPILNVPLYRAAPPIATSWIYYDTYYDDGHGHNVPCRRDVYGATTSNFLCGLISYKAIPRHVKIFAQAVPLVGGGILEPTVVFDDQGTGLNLSSWSLIREHNYGATVDDYVLEEYQLLDPYPVPTNWYETAAPGTAYGCKVCYPVALITPTFEYQP